MKKMTIFAGGLVLALISAPAQAHTNEICNYQTDYNLTVKDSNITFDDESGQEITINQENRLFVNGVEQSLDSTQKQLVNNYANGVRGLISEVTTIAVEGVNLGVEAASLALGSLLGEGEPEFQKFSGRIKSIASSVTEKIDSQNFSSKALEQTFNEDFEREIETVVEEAVLELTPVLMAKLVTAAITGNEEGISNIEARTSALEQEIESFVEPKAEALKARAEELCDSVKELNGMETKMVSSGLEMMDILGVETSGENAKKSKRFNLNLGE